MQYLGTVSKTTEWSLFMSRQTIQYHTNPSLCPTTNDEEAAAEWRSLPWRPTRNFRTNTKKKSSLPFIIGNWNAKVGSQEISGVTGKSGLGLQNKVGQRLTDGYIKTTRECTAHSKQSLPTTWETTLHMDITRWSIPKTDWLYSLQLKMEKLYTVIKNKTGSRLWLRSWTPYCKIQTKLSWRKQGNLLGLSDMS